MRICSVCKSEKDSSEFYKHGNGLRSECKRCTSAASKRRNETNSEVRRKAWNTYRFKTYGLSTEQYDEMYEQQEGRCKICGTEVLKFGDSSEIIKVACIDHCHVTGKVRGLLCRPCNSGIGHMRDSTELLRRAILYLEGTDENLFN